jgi:hypothetical protein
MKIDRVLVQKELDEAIGRAEYFSKDGCVRHVNASVSLFGDELHICFIVSEWYAHGQTVASYINGKEV